MPVHGYGVMDPYRLHGSLDPHESVPPPKRHLNRSSRLSTTQPCDQRTDRQTHGPRYVRHLRADDAA